MQSCSWLRNGRGEYDNSSKPETVGGVNISLQVINATAWQDFVTYIRNDVFH